ncbi:ABC transporter permease [Thalassobacillus pellis]|uniref:ABC transporter permease n=1 Tax=Thalassobacillus pellis TaxID=748008 RepID=UPI0019603D01|nr:ABC transporter permease [Thalassobacillus pellis]MBM7551884.1 ribose transport system permease protein [Thalassobacillus pellis]
MKAAVQRMTSSIPIRFNASLIQQQGAFIALVLLIIYASLSYENFLTSQNIINVLKQNSMIGIVAVGMTFVILTKGIDLSVGSLIALGGVLSAYLTNVNMILALIIPIAITALLGMVNGLIISRGNLEPFIVTLAMMIGVRGIVFIITGEQSVIVTEGAEYFYYFLGNGLFLGVPFPVWLLLLIVGISWYVLKMTRFGRHTYAVGGSENASQLMGVKTKNIKVWVYVISGTLSGLAGIILAGRLGGVAQPVAGNMWELDAIAAVVIGGTLLAGGRGGVIGTFIGVMLLGIVLNVINLDGTLNSWWQPVIRGLFLLAIVIIQAKIMNTKKLKT